MKRSAIYLTAAIAWFLICTWLLTLPGSSLPKENWLDKLQIDKVVHILMFGTLTCIWCLAINRKKSFLLIALLGVSYGIAMEFVQRYCIPHRSFDVWDIVADAAGCVAGYYFAKRYINRKQGI